MGHINKTSQYHKGEGKSDRLNVATVSSWCDNNIIQ